jgi:hypothetical protein
MHIKTDEVEAYIERQARKYSKNFDTLPSGEQWAVKFGVAQVMVWDLIMDLDPDMRAKRIKQMKAGA